LLWAVCIFSVGSEDGLSSFWGLGEGVFSLDLAGVGIPFAVELLQVLVVVDLAKEGTDSEFADLWDVDHFVEYHKHHDIVLKISDVTLF
jgi:hypothetical protein